MTTKDYKAAAKKLNKFVHESRMARDPEYRLNFIMGKRICRLLDEAIWGPVYIMKKTEPSYDGIMPRLLHI
jgi:hypothetical protein